ncbi:MAG: response regulator, partial [Isosphaeraceae bacterium]
MSPSLTLPIDSTEARPQCGGDASLFHVLIVDDNPIDRLQASWLVGLDTRCRVVSAEDGARALELMANQDVAIVLTDLKMEGMDGLALVRAVRKDHPHVPVILMTAHGSEDVAMEALRFGATDYVPKARLTQDLHAILSRTLRTATAGNRRRQCLHSLLRRESRFELGNDPDILPPFLELLQDEMSQLGRWDSTEVMRMTIAVDEAIRNAMYHGNLEVRSVQ